MNTLTQATVKTIHADITTALKAVGEKYGVHFMFERLRFDSHTFTANMKVTVPMEGGASPDEDKFKRLAASFGVKPEDYNRALTVRGKQYRLVEIRPQAVHYPFILATKLGAKYKFGHSEVLTALGYKGDTTPTPATPITESNTYIPSFSGKAVKEDEAWDMIAADDKKAGPGLAAGRMLRFPKADGYAIYIVTKVGAQETEVFHVNLGDAWHSEAVHNGKIKTAIAKKNVEGADAMRKLFNN